MRRRWSALPVAALLATSVGLAACGGGHPAARSTTSAPTAAVTDTTTLAPAAALQAAATTLVAGPALTVTASLGASAAQLRALVGSSALTSAQAQLLAGESLTLVARAAGSSLRADVAAGGDQLGESVSATVTGPHPNLAQAVYAGRTVYVRLDVATLAGAVGYAAELQRIAGRADLPGTYGFLQAAAAGAWVSLTGTDLVQVLKATSPSGIPTVGPSQVAALTGALDRLVGTDVTVTRAAADATLGDHLVVTGDARTLVTDLDAAAAGSLGTLPGVPELLALVHADRVPATTVRLDAYARGGVLDEVTVDLGQLLGSARRTAVGTGSVLTLRFAPTGTVTAPTGATAVPASTLEGLLGQAAG